MLPIQSYFNPVNSDIYADKSRWETTQIGRGIEAHTESFFPDVRFAEIAIFNIPEYEGSKNTASENISKLTPANEIETDSAQKDYSYFFYKGYYSKLEIKA